MTPIRDYILHGSLPEWADTTQKIRTIMARCVIHNESLYRILGDWSLLKRVTREEGNYILREMHEGICKATIGTNTLVWKNMRYGYFWLAIQENAKEMMRACNRCQIHSNDHHVPQNEHHCMTSLIPFAEWGMDHLGPFPKARGGKEYHIVSLDYFTR